MGVLASTGTFEGADAAALDDAGLDDGALGAVGPDEASSGLGEVSVYADATTWAAAVSVRPNGVLLPEARGGQGRPALRRGHDVHRSRGARRARLPLVAQTSGGGGGSAVPGGAGGGRGPAAAWAAGGPGGRHRRRRGRRRVRLGPDEDHHRRAPIGRPSRCFVSERITAMPPTR